MSEFVPLVGLTIIHTKGLVAFDGFTVIDAISFVPSVGSIIMNVYVLVALDDYSVINVSKSVQLFDYTLLVVIFFMFSLVVTL